MGIFNTTEKVLTRAGEDLTAFIEFARSRHEGWGDKADSYVESRKTKHEHTNGCANCRNPSECICSFSAKPAASDSEEPKTV